MQLKLDILILIAVIVISAGGYVSAGISQPNEAHIPVTSGSTLILILVGIIGYSVFRRR